MDNCLGTCGFQDTSFLQYGCAGSQFSHFMGIVNFLVNTQLTLSDPCNRVGKDGSAIENGSEYDYIVVGAGVGGSVVASRLSEDPFRKVLLLEAGPEEPTATQIPAFSLSGVGTNIDWQYTTVAQKKACLSTGGVCRWPRGRMVSGTGAMNGMMYVRGHSTVFDQWEKNGNPGWTYHRGLLPYFIKSEHNMNPDYIEAEFHGTEGPMVVQKYSNQSPMTYDILQAGMDVGFGVHDLNGVNQTGINIAQVMVKDNLRSSVGRVYLRPAVGRNNLNVAINSHVKQVMIDETSKRAYGVKFVDSNGDEKVVTAIREVIVSAGAVGSPQLLMLSGIGPKADLDNVEIKQIQELPVGKNLHNHVSIGLGFRTNDPAVETLNMDTLTEFFNNRTGPLAGTGLTQITAFLHSRHAQDIPAPDIQVFWDGFLANCSATGLNAECTDGKLEKCAGRYIVARPTLVSPRSRGFITLASNDYRDYPIIEPRYFDDVKDEEALLDGVRKVLELVKAPGLAKWNFQPDGPVPGCDQHEFDSDEYWFCAIENFTGPENHQSGSCKMGPVSDPDAVVDSKLKVHGIKGLRVVDASVYPQVPNANPIPSLLAIGEKAAHMILSENI